MTINISMTIGRDIRTRSFFRRDIEKLIGDTDSAAILDFTDVMFVSRSVADEICNVLCDYPNARVVGMAGDVEMMYSVVVNGRSKPRIYSEDEIKVVHLKTLDEMEDFFSSF